MSLEAKIKALLEGTDTDNLLSEEELVESIVEIDEEGNPILESSNEEDENEEDEKDEKDEKGSSDNNKIKAGLSRKLEANGEIKASSTDEPNNKKNNVTKNMQEHIDALTTGEELSEDFKTKAAVILEAAIAEGVEKELLRLEEEHNQKLDEAVNTIKAELVENIDGFLNVIVEKWMEENELALERGIKVDIVENFIDGMKNLFKENYIEVPEEKLDILDEQANQIEELLAINNELVESIEKLKEDVNASKKALVIENVGSELTDTEFEKFASLLENIEYSDDFENKATTILESYFPKAKVKTTDIDDTGSNLDESKSIDGQMSKYVTALAGQLKF